MFMGMIFHQYKTLLDLANNSTNKEFGVDQEIVALEVYKPQTKEDLFDKTYEKWLGLINSLHKDDREQFLKMIGDCCNGITEEAAKRIIEKDSKNSLSLYLFFYLIIQNQKLIDRLNPPVQKKRISGLIVLSYSLKNIKKYYQKCWKQKHSLTTEGMICDFWIIPNNYRVSISIGGFFYCYSAKII